MNFDEHILQLSIIQFVALHINCILLNFDEQLGA